MQGLALLIGMAVGLPLGLTGGGGSLFAVPLLVFGLSMAPHEAVGVSLVAVGAVALIGVARKVRSGLLVARGGALMAAGGMVTAPLGAWLARQLPDAALLIAFALLMLFIAVLMWRTAGRPGVGKEVPAHPDGEAPPHGLTCRFDPAGRLRITSRCAFGLVGAGALTGALSGLFGVGGGFLVVPALIFATGMSIHRAVATSLLVIVLVSASGSLSYALAHPGMPWGQVGLFVTGGIAGLEMGGRMAKRISGPQLQRGFSVTIVAVSLFVIVKTLANT